METVEAPLDPPCTGPPPNFIGRGRGHAIPHHSPWPEEISEVRCTSLPPCSPHYA